MFEFAIALYADLCAFVVPVSVVFGIGDLIIHTLLDSALGGRLWMRKS